MPTGELVECPYLSVGSFRLTTTSSFLPFVVSLPQSLSVAPPPIAPAPVAADVLRVVTTNDRRRPRPPPLARRSQNASVERTGPSAHTNVNIP